MLLLHGYDSFVLSYSFAATPALNSLFTNRVHWLSYFSGSIFRLHKTPTTFYDQGFHKFNPLSDCSVDHLISQPRVANVSPVKWRATGRL